MKNLDKFKNSLFKKAQLSKLQKPKSGYYLPLINPKKNQIPFVNINNYRNQCNSKTIISNKNIINEIEENRHNLLFNNKSCVFKNLIKEYNNSISISNDKGKNIDFVKQQTNVTRQKLKEQILRRNKSNYYHSFNLNKKQKSNVKQNSIDNFVLFNSSFGK